MDILVTINNQPVFEGNAEDYLESMDYDTELELFLSNFMTDNKRQIETYQSDDTEIEFEKIENILQFVVDRLKCQWYSKRVNKIN